MGIDIRNLNLIGFHDDSMNGFDDDSMVDRDIAKLLSNNTRAVSYFLKFK